MAASNKDKKALAPLTKELSWHTPPLLKASMSNTLSQCKNRYTKYRLLEQAQPITCTYGTKVQRNSDIMSSEEMKNLSTGDSMIPVEENKSTNKFVSFKSKVRKKTHLSLCCWIALLPSAVLLILITTCLIRMYTVMSAPKHNICVPHGAHHKVNTLDKAALNRFQQVIQEKSISYEAHKYNNASFLRLHKLLQKLYPKVHASSSITRTVINTYSLLYKVQGTNSSLKPYMLNAHLDVVQTEGQTWTVAPFQGEIRDGFIYGRGAIDMKHCLVAIFESIERLLTLDYEIERSFYISCGHDEEVLGYDGAGQIAKHLEYNGISDLEFILDEGTPIVQGVIDGISDPVALVGVAEKGYSQVKLEVTGDAGHSSVPMHPSNIGILARAVQRLEDIGQVSKLEGISRTTFEGLAPHMSFFKRFILSNIWLFSAVLKKSLSKIPTNSALIRATTSITKFNSGIKDNIVPDKATAFINHRTLPYQDMKEVIERNRQVIDDPRVKITLVEEAMSDHVSSANTKGFDIIRRAIGNVFKGTIVLPGLCIGRTDGAHFTNLSKNIYRVSPALLDKDGVKRIHGRDERISVDNYRKVIEFYMTIMKLSDLADIKCNT